MSARGTPRRTEITARELGRRPSWVLAAVAAGGSVTVTGNGVAVARVVPTGAEAPPGAAGSRP
ncbi:type II toxin-antitoxin system prevent-host-death family antitoxin [Streptomyces sp. WAC02707]|uniref:Type II toxin-antitoxin system Phd/YefM family antitoxin n=1 Tax=Streptomyces bikiniensis TaxID=1896 RepID=A0ABW8CPE5_STRBI|nr:type II toxin-antitoxin system prevent-host-death family antitoxin [Streptomyces sp. WAC02707]RSS83084.1 type II toxin-antitoxin system prevent-host-death family antitoxin [Streptomyces sp. WAC02707]